MTKTAEWSGIFSKILSTYNYQTLNSLSSGVKKIVQTVKQRSQK